MFVFDPINQGLELLARRDLEKAENIPGGGGVSGEMGAALDCERSGRSSSSKVSETLKGCKSKFVPLTFYKSFAFINRIE